MAAKHPDLILILDMEIDALLTARPTTLREPKLAVEAAEHEALLTRRHQPSVLLSLAEAYRSAGQIERARAIAREGLALLPPASPTEASPSRTRKLLELQEN